VKIIFDICTLDCDRLVLDRCADLLGTFVLKQVNRSKTSKTGVFEEHEEHRLAYGGAAEDDL